MTRLHENDGLPNPRRGRAAAAIWLAMAVTVADTQIANVALPTIAHGFGAAPAAVLWVVQAYQLAIVMALLVCSALGDRYGYARVYLVGLLVFTLASLGCAGAPGLWWLVAARFGQGLGAAAIMGVNGALVRLTFPTARLGSAFGINVLVIAVSATSAPVLAGAILAWAGWRWLFAINLALGGGALVIGAWALPAGKGGLAGIDWPAGGLCALAMLCLFGAAAHLAGGTALALAGAVLALGVALLLALWRLSRAAPQPLVPFDLIAMPVLARAYLGSIGNFAAQTSLLVALPFYLRQTYRLGALQSGLIMATLPAGLAFAAPLAGRLSDHGTGIGHFGLPLAGLALLALWAFAGHSPFVVAACAGFAGIGFGLFQAPNNRVMIAAAPRARSGAAAGMLAMARLTGQMAGVIAAMVALRAGGALN